MAQRENVVEFISRRPHLLFRLGFSESRVYAAHDASRTSHLDIRPFYGVGGRRGPIGKMPEVLYRDSTDGRWWWLDYVRGMDFVPRDDHEELSRAHPGATVFWRYADSTLPLHLSFLDREGKERVLSATGLLSMFGIRNFEPGPLGPAPRSMDDDFQLTPSVASASDLRTVLLPEVTSLCTIEDEPLISSTVGGLLLELQRGQQTLAEVRWQDLEDIVAELLRSLGMTIRTTKRTRDGGRDLIAVGEWIPGFKSELAVEVTARRVVGIEKVAHALYRNRHYPMLMVATNGRFSSGVTNERQLDENRLRLVLADGALLSQWIECWRAQTTE